MRILKYLLPFLLLLLIIWIDLPENYKIKFPLGRFKVDYTVHPLSIDWNFFGFQIKKEFRTHLGLDLKGGSHLVFETDTSKVKKEDLQDALSSSRDIIEKRVNFFGVSEPTVQTIKSGNNYRISVDLPGIENVNQAIGLIGQTAQLFFKEEASVEAKIGPFVQ